MNISENELEQRLASRLMDALIRAALIFMLALLCYRIFAPFLSLMVWASILAVTLYPVHQALASKLGGKQGLAATLLVILSLVLIVGPTAVLTNSLGDSVHDLVTQVRDNSLVRCERLPPSPGTLWSAFVTTLTHKAESAGAEVKQVSPNYTSQDCVCGRREKSLSRNALTTAPIAVS